MTIFLLMNNKSHIKTHFLFQKETYELNGIAFDIHSTLGRGFLEIVYKDAFEYELKKRGIHFEREKEYVVEYKNIILPHKFYADFVVKGKIIAEIKAQSGIAENHYGQVINYLAVSKCPIGLIYNFGEPSLIVKRVIF